MHALCGLRALYRVYPSHGKTLRMIPRINVLLGNSFINTIILVIEFSGRPVS